MRPADTWKDYELLDATDGNRLERWGETLLVRPCLLYTSDAADE